jgi:predicted nucleotidyltransferase component of viral defense system
MKTTNEMQLKALVKGKAIKLGITPQAALQIYCLERFLERMSMSEKRNCFILKGGFLISAMIGVEHRSTMDIDATIKGFDVNQENVSNIFKGICEIKIDDQLDFVFDRVEDIRETDDYPGIRVFLKAQYGKMDTTLTVDVTTGDSIVPSEIKFAYKCVFDDKVIPVMAYPVENVFAEKLETIISRGIANTRPRDYYDVHILYLVKKDAIDFNILKQALESTARKRGSYDIMKNYPHILNVILNDTSQNNFWKRYVSKNLFAKGITFQEVVESAKTLLDRSL